MSDCNGTTHRNGKTVEPPPLAPFANGHRDPKSGHFTKGNPGGPGNPCARRAAALKQSFLKAATPEKLQELAEKLLGQALAGDITAASLFLAYALGKPRAEPDADRLDLDELDLLRKGPSREQLRLLLTATLAPAATAAFCRAMLVGCHRSFAAELTAINPDLGLFFREAARLSAEGETDEPA